MANVIDYIKWRGDLNLLQDEFNEIDNLILSRFSYFPLDNLIKKDETVSIKELSERFKNTDISKMKILWPNDVDLFPVMGESKRFGKMKVTKYINKVKPEKEEQFSAVTIIMPDDTLYVSYRGTDNTVVGWKEDLNMSFKSHVAGQLESKKYLEEIANKYPNKLRVGGHSKGGNFAIYASIFAENDIKDRIINIYNNDGPGFGDDIIQTEEYKGIIKKVNTYIPQESVFGRLLNHEEKYTIVESIEKGFMQHDLYTWQVLGNKFIYLKEVTSGSNFIDKSIKDWLKQVDAKQREQVIDIIFEIINSTNVETVSELKKQWFSNAGTLFKSYRQVDEENRKMIFATLTELLKVVKNNFIEEHKNQKNK